MLMTRTSGQLNSHRATAASNMKNGYVESSWGCNQPGSTLWNSCRASNSSPSPSLLAGLLQPMLPREWDTPLRDTGQSVEACPPTRSTDGFGNQRRRFCTHSVRMRLGSIVRPGEISALTHQKMPAYAESLTHFTVP